MTDERGERIVITGATGNTGSLVVRRLLDQVDPRSIVALVRESSDTRWLQSAGVELHVCDLSSPSTYLSKVEPGSVFVGVANLRFSDQMMPHLVKGGISRAFCVTTTAVFSSYHSYGALYREIEDRLCSNSVPITLLRPSMIYGNARDHNMRKLIAVMQRTPVYPVFGPGTALMQPVFVEDLAQGIVSAVQRQVTGAFNLAGPEALTYNDLLNTVASVLDRKVRLLHIDHRIAAGVVKVLQHAPKFPVKHEQVMRLQEDKAFDISRASELLDYRPRSFEDGIRLQVEQRRNGRSVPNQRAGFL